MNKNNHSYRSEDNLNPEISRSTFVGRDKEMAQIKAAISTPGLHIVNINGPGGIGKTSILNQIQRDYKDNTEIQISEIIDFFDIAANTPQGFMEHLISALPDDSEQYFEPYRKAQNRVDQIESAGITGEILQDELKKVFSTFNECLNQLTSARRTVILLDTFEEIRINFRDWLTTCLMDLQNVVLIVAGRKNDEWQNILEEKIDKDIITYLPLASFKMEDTVALIRQSEHGKNISDEELEKLQILSEGYPILLILAVDKKWPKCVRGGNCPQKECTLTGEKYTLQDLQSMHNNLIKSAREEFRKELIERTLNLKNELKPYAIAILLMAHIYKYFTTELFDYLENIGTESARKILDAIREWTFIKFDSKSCSFRLHDVMRDLVIEYVWPGQDPYGGKRQHFFEKTSHFYQTILLVNIENQIQKWQAERKQYRTIGDKDQEFSAYRKIKELKNLKRNFEAHTTYYRIVRDYEKGIEIYQLMFENNLWVKDTQANDLLKKERDMALKSLNQEYPLYLKQLDMAKECIVIHRKFDEALKILSNHITLDMQQKATPYLKAVQCLYCGIAWNSKGEYQKGQEALNTAILEFENYEKWLSSHQNESGSLTSGNIKRSLARVYGSLGLGHLMAGRLTDAVSAYEKALSYSKGGRIE
jgi:tetratricopeptide (TPR) repeat protein